MQRFVSESRVALAVEIAGIDTLDGDVVILVWQQRADGRPWPELSHPDRMASVPGQQEAITHVFEELTLGIYSVLAFQAARRSKLAPLQIAGWATSRAGASNAVHPVAAVKDLSAARFCIDCFCHVTIRLQRIRRSKVLR